MQNDAQLQVERIKEMLELLLRYRGEDPKTNYTQLMATKAEVTDAVYFLESLVEGG